MGINFSRIPQTIRVPLFYAEVDPSQANSGQQNQRGLIIAQKTSSGAAPADIPLLCQGVSDAKTQGGPGSMLARMVDKWRKNDPLGELWMLPLADNGAGVAASGSIKFTHVATANGVLSLYIAGDPLNLNVSTTQTLANLATALAAAINAATDLPVTAVVNGSDPTQVDITAKNKGTAGNDIDLRANYYSTAGNEVLPTALTMTITALSGGATNPVLTTALTNCMDMPFDFIVLANTDTTSLDALKTFLNDAAGRWSYTNQVYGHVFYSYSGSLSALTTLGAARNDQHASNLGFYQCPTPGPERAAAYAAAAAVSLRADPARPLQTLEVDGILAPVLQSRFALTDRDTLLHTGISTFTVDPDGTVRLENVITTYLSNSFGQPDDSYLQVETMYQLMAILRRLKGMATSKFGRCKLVKDNTRVAAGSSTVTPAIVRASLIAEYQAMEEAGLVQDSQGFAAGLKVEIAADNPSRLNVLWDGTLSNGLRIFAVLAQFRKA